ncbi:1-phosphofructokinase family hexose kinase [Pseudohoeflea suaedae]|uniref:Phosphofructokinase n=1 Tax=Pseudohoeflea suaedae TaxID=877384 RepID=A0A4R5PHC3_9HYPH|nr:1-phosphofructokinase family hexose kinase [Pseudohoeflea suaedae]TDH34300.1 1-phosphofructokinase family hexose kinase [Pseudohoeflea suaedae]
MSRTLSIALNPTIDISSDTARIHATRKIRTSNQRWHPGGGGVNVARVIAMLSASQGGTGDKPHLMMFSGGQTGTLLEGMLSDLSIDLHPISIAEQTRIAFMVYEEESGFEYRFVPEGPEVSEDEFAQAMEVVRGFSGDYVIASGSLPRHAPLDTYARMADIANSNGARFVLDTSGPALKATLDNARVFLFKPSLGELETLAGRKLDEAGVIRTARALVEDGKTEHVTVTLGREGALLISRDRVLRVPARHVVVKSAVGAGDSFVGALVWYLAQGHSIDEAFRFGVAAGAAAARTPGTELCHADDVFEIFNSPDDR